MGRALSRTGPARLPRQHREEYRRLIRAYAHRHFSGRLGLGCGGSGPRAALASAKREGLSLPHRGAAVIEEAKVLSPEQLAAVLAMAPERHRLLLELLAGTGLRISEAIGLQRLHFQLDDGPPEVCIRRALVKGRIVPPKSRHGHRDVRLSASLAARAEAHLSTQSNQDPTALVFTNEAGGPIDPGNLRQRVLKPLVEEAGAPWAGFHTFRHTFASLHLSRGTNLLQLSRALGHHSAAFTLSRYTHLLPGDGASALELDATPRQSSAQRPDLVSQLGGEGNALPPLSEVRATEGVAL